MSKKVNNLSKVIQDEIKEQLPLSLTKYTKKIKGIHNLINKLLIIADDNCEHLKIDIPMANKMIYEQSQYISTKKYLYELVAAKVNKDFEFTLTFFTIMFDVNSLDDDADCDLTFVADVCLSNGTWKVVRLEY